jgi:hypothetical protein
VSANPPDAGRVAALAARLQVEPRALFVAVARLAAAADAPPDGEGLRRELARVAAAPEPARDAAALALLGPGAYALDDVERALGMAWSARVRLP